MAANGSSAAVNVSNVRKLSVFGHGAAAAAADLTVKCSPTSDGTYYDTGYSVAMPTSGDFYLDMDANMDFVQIQASAECTGSTVYIVGKN